MAENNTELTQEQREEQRRTQLAILGSDSLRNLVVAGVGRDISKYGEVGKQSTHGRYLNALSSPDEYLGHILASSFLKAEQESGELYGGAVTPLHLLNTAKNFYYGGLDNIQVRDIFELIGADVSTEAITDEQRQMYIGDIKKEDEQLYNKLLSAFASYTEMTGVGKAITETGKSIAGNLEKILTQEN